MLRQNEREAQRHHDGQDAEFEILSAVKKAIPCPDMLRQGHGDQLNRCQDQQEPAQQTAQVQSIRGCVEGGPLCDRTTNQGVFNSL